MTNITIIENKAALVRKYLLILKAYSKYSKKLILADVTYRGAVLHYLYQAIQSTIDLAQAYAAYKKYPKPQSARDVFHALHEHKKISRILLNNMLNMTGFRNIMAHQYAIIDDEIFYDIFANHLKDIRGLLKALGM